MITTFNLVEIVYHLLDSSYIKELITGDIYKFTRPLGSRSQDVVVNCLPISGDDIQDAVVNINIHLTNLFVKINGQDDYSQPDTVLFQEVTDRIIGLVTGNPEYWDKEGIDVVIQNQSGPIPEPDFKEHFVNIRVQINLPNI